MKPLALLIVAVACLTTTAAQAQFPVFPSADLVLGQPDFTSDALPAASQASLGVPTGVAVDPVSGKVFVSLSLQNRILRFANSAALANGANAEAVIGQGNYTSTLSDTTATTLNSPFIIDVDHLGRLWVADFLNNRVLMYADAANLPEFGATANLVLGQPNFTIGSASTTRRKMSSPSGVYVDAADNLWVADYGNHRVLKFANASSLTNSSPATTVLGQADFDTGTSGTTAAKMHEPTAVEVDQAGRLWVAERSNDRVLRFDNAATLSDGAAANGVLGQSDFTSGTGGATPETFNQPSALAIDRSGTLYIADFANHRVVYHKNPAAKANGATPDGVIGQPDLLTVMDAATAQKLQTPFGLEFDAVGRLWVADRSNHRILRFPGDFTATAPKIKGKAPKSVTTGKVPLKGTSADPNGIAQVRYRVGKGAFKNAVGTTAWKLKAKLKPGKNTIEIVAVDSFGNVSPPKRVKVKRE
jgi:DNA-binding beta-propeller fold protein YncE